MNFKIKFSVKTLPNHLWFQNFVGNSPYFSHYIMTMIVVEDFDYLLEPVVYRYIIHSRISDVIQM